ncbi:MAG: polyprenyl synthetase family protein [Chloroflexi bacterium]|nr:polyprenyl synthetase family protein [Chloroflexota bacterium]
MPLEKYRELFIPMIENELFATLRTVLNESYPELKEAIYYHFGFSENESIQKHGKFIRPLLILLTAELLEQDWHKILPAACAVEMLHNLSLIHDDVEDHSALRRGRATVWKRWGVEKAINIGDALFAIAGKTVQTVSEGINVKNILQGSQAFMQCSFSLFQGQQMDMAYENQPSIRLDDYLEMIAGKTGALLAFSSEISAILFNEEKEIRNKLHSFGLNLGLAFQIYDDWLGIWGDEWQTGKPGSSDLIEKKISYPVLLGMQQITEFKQIWLGSKEFSPGQLSEMVELLDRHDIQQQTLSTAAYYNDKALSMIKAIGGNRNALNAIVQLTDELLDRNY